MAGAGQLADRAPAYFKCVAGGTKGEEFAHWSQVWEEAGALFTERERAALAWAETVTRVADTTILDDAYKAASAILAEKELVDLAIAIGLMNAYNRLTIMHTRAT
jgi:alkylhydroperoxidase family enzyme